MQRCPEPELMDASDQVLAYAEADFSAGDQSVLEGLLALIDHSCVTLPLDSLILDLGCGIRKRSRDGKGAGCVAWCFSFLNATFSD
ncbi:hypothetical protein OAL34_02700 [Synechococcus sp. AH-551-G03]|nr:hypothetical protein [Synechococcus sp. AH-551-G03]